MRRWGLTCLTSRKAHCVSSRQTAKVWLKLDGWIRKTNHWRQPSASLPVVALAMIGVIGAIGLEARQVITGINAIIAGQAQWGQSSTQLGTVMTAIGAISWPVVAVVDAIVARALLIRKYWEPVGAFFGGVVEGAESGILRRWGNCSRHLSRCLTGWAKSYGKAAWQWFKT